MPETTPAQTSELLIVNASLRRFVRAGHGNVLLLGTPVITTLTVIALLDVTKSVALAIGGGAVIVALCAASYRLYVARVEIARDVIRIVRATDEISVPLADVSGATLVLRRLWMTAEMRLQLRGNRRIRAWIVGWATSRGSLESAIDWLTAALQKAGVQVRRTG